MAALMISWYGLVQEAQRLCAAIFEGSTDDQDPDES